MREKVLTVNGSTYVTYGDILNKGASDSFTVELKFSSTTTGTTKVLAGKATLSGGSVTLGWSLSYQATNDIRFRVHDGVDTVALDVPGAQYLDGNVHHVSAVVDRTAVVLYLYVNGVLCGTSSSISAVGTVSTSGAATLRVGAANDATVPFAGGTLYDFRIWGEARTATQIKDNVNTILTGSETNLDLATRITEGGGSTASDS